MRVVIGIALAAINGRAAVGNCEVFGPRFVPDHLRMSEDGTQKKSP